MKKYYEPCVEYDIYSKEDVLTVSMTGDEKENFGNIDDWTTDSGSI